MQTAVTSKHARFPRKIVDQSKDLFCEMSPQWSDPHFMGVFKVIIKIQKCVCVFSLSSSSAPICQSFNIWKHFENEKGSVNQKYIQVTLMIYDVVHRFNRLSHMFLYVWVKDKQHVNRI